MLKEGLRAKLISSFAAFSSLFTLGDECADFFSPCVLLHALASFLGGDERKGITVSTEELIPIEGSRGEAHYVMKWPTATEQSYIKIIPHKEVAEAYTADNSGEFVAVLALECRGIEITKWHPSFDFDVETAGGFRYDHEKVDLSDREWAEYDEENDLSVSIANLEYRID